MENKERGRKTIMYLFLSSEYALFFHLGFWSDWALVSESHQLQCWERSMRREQRYSIHLYLKEPSLAGELVQPGTNKACIHIPHPCLSRFCGSWPASQVLLLEDWSLGHSFRHRGTKKTVNKTWSHERELSILHSFELLHSMQLPKKPCGFLLQNLSYRNTIL